MIWLVGNKGMLGTELGLMLKERGIPFCGSDREISILEPEALRRFAEEYQPSWIVNCSAYTAVDRAETDADAAYALNRDGAANLARLAAERDIPVVHLSTDYVFNGKSPVPLDEEAEPDPNTVYGKSKLAGEVSIRRTWGKHFIVRTAWLYGRYGSNFVFTMLKLMNGKDSIKVVRDQQGSPTWARNLAEFILTICTAESADYGIYHYSGEGSCNWFDFAREIYKCARETGLVTSSCRIDPCSSDEYVSAARRPAYSLLSKKKAGEVFSVTIPSWKDSLNQFLKGLTYDDLQPYL